LGFNENKKEEENKAPSSFWSEKDYSNDNDPSRYSKYGDVPIADHHLP